MKNTVLITGGTSGIGLEFAKLFARQGKTLLLVARNAKDLADQSVHLATSHADTRIYTLSADLSKDTSVSSILAFIKKHNLFIHTLINNAGFGLPGHFAFSQWNLQKELLSVNVLNLLKLTHALLPSMMERKHGYILNVASTAAFQPGPYMATYYASKSFLYSWSLSLSEELRHTGVNVTVLCPGPTKTNFPRRAAMSSSMLFSLFPLMDPFDVARAGYKGLMEGKRVVVPGFMNYIQWKFIRFMPLGTLLKLVGKIH